MTIATAVLSFSAMVTMMGTLTQWVEILESVLTHLYLFSNKRMEVGKVRDTEQLWGVYSHADMPLLESCW